MLHYKVAVKIVTSYPFSEPALCRSWATAVATRAVIIIIVRACADGIHKEEFFSVLTCQSTEVNLLEADIIQNCCWVRLKIWKSPEIRFYFLAFG